MLSILLVTFPFFALVGCGYLAVRRVGLPQTAIPGLNSFVLYFALPCMLYRFGANTPVAVSLNPAVMGVHLTVAVLMVSTYVYLARRWKRSWNNAAFGALAGTFPNTGFMGVPLLITLLGTPAAGPTIATILVDIVVTSSLCIALSRLDSGGVGLKASATMFKGMLTNPMPWAIVLGAGASVTGFALPKPVNQTISLLADAASPVALFTIGAVLARSRSNSGTSNWTEISLMALIKLLFHPVLMLSVGHAAIALGVPLDLFALHVMVLVAALPCASNVAMLAERFGADSSRVAHVIMVSTVLAFFTFSAAVSLMSNFSSATNVPNPSKPSAESPRQTQSDTTQRA